MLAVTRMLLPVRATGDSASTQLAQRCSCFRSQTAFGKHDAAQSSFKQHITRTFCDSCKQVFLYWTAHGGLNPEAGQCIPKLVSLAAEFPGSGVLPSQYVVAVCPVENSTLVEKSKEGVAGGACRCARKITKG